MHHRPTNVTGSQLRGSQEHLVAKRSRPLASASAALHAERRANRRLRDLLTEMRDVLREMNEQVLQNRRDLNLQFTRIASLQAELDVLRAETVTIARPPKPRRRGDGAATEHTDETGDGGRQGPSR